MMLVHDDGIVPLREIHCNVDECQVGLSPFEHRATCQVGLPSIESCPRPGRLLTTFTSLRLSFRFLLPAPPELNP